jgi:hemoglobin-like flavoprotein
VSGEFIPAFYKRFLATSEDVRRKFQNTDFEKQNKMLLRSLQLVAAATKGEREGLQELRERAETHDRYHLDIKPDLYDVWLSAVVETAREYDKEWIDETEDAWTAILTYAIDYMVRRY